MGSDSKCIGVEISKECGEAAKKAIAKALQNGLSVRGYENLSEAVDDLKAGKICALVAPGDTKEIGEQVFAKYKRELPKIYGFKDGRLRKRIIRLPICLILPNSIGGHFVLCDAGASTEMDDQDGYINMLFGAQLAFIALNRTSPRVAVLGIGEEDYKMRSLDRAILQHAEADFATGFLRMFGNGIAEPKPIMNGEVDVVIASGREGNLKLKFTEVGVKLLWKYCSYFLSKAIWMKALAYVAVILAVPSLILLTPLLYAMWKHWNPSRYAGGVLAGCPDLVLICHGSSKQKDILRAIQKARDYSNLQMPASLLSCLTRVRNNHPEWFVEESKSFEEDSIVV
jgi:fatty acid/phospholipid biosynthesis enzyme